MNAAFLGNGHNGISTYIRGLIKAFKERGCCHGDEEYVVYTSIVDEMPPDCAIKWRRVSANLSQEGRRLGNVLRTAWTQFVLPFLLVRDKVDVLLSPLPDSPILAKTPRVVVVHDLIPLFYPEETPRIAYYTRLIVPLFLRTATRVIADSTHTKEDLVREFGLVPGKVSVVPLGVDECYFLPDCQCEQPPHCPERFFLFVGACLPRKKPLDVVRAYARVRDLVEEELVLVMSTGTQFEEVKEAVQELGLLDRVVFYTALRHRQILFLYRRATALVFLSEYEGFGYPAAEALASGTPVIVSACTSLPEVVGDAGIIVQPADLDGVAQAMLNVTIDPDLCNRLKQRARLRAEAFRWEHIANELVAVVAGAVEKSNQPALSKSVSGVN